jgi:hypothetical protein
MQNLLLALMLITAADLDGIAHAADDVPGTIAVESQQVFPSSSTPNTSANAPAKNHSPDCNVWDRPAPSARTRIDHCEGSAIYDSPSPRSVTTTNGATTMPRLHPLHLP